MSRIDNNRKDSPQGDREVFFPPFTNEGNAHAASPYSPSSPKALNQASPRKSEMPEILLRIKDPNRSVDEITRLIQVEMTLIIQDMRACDSDGATHRRGDLMRQMRALCALENSIKEHDAKMRQDEQILDEPTFRFLVGELIDCFKKATLEALDGDKDVEQNIMRHFRDTLGSYEEELRRKLRAFGRRKDASRTLLPPEEATELPEPFKVKEVQSRETPPTGLSEGKKPNEEVTPKTPTSLQNEGSEHTRARNSVGQSEFSTKFIDGQADRDLIEDIKKSMRLEDERDDFGTLSDWGADSDDSTPPGGKRG